MLSDWQRGILLHTYESNSGIKATYEAWLAQPEEDRQAFFRKPLLAGIEVLERDSDTRLDGVPLVISGMASSSIGLMDLPYLSLPFPLDGRRCIVEKLQENDSFRHAIYLISGISKPGDVMRGEETQVLGWFACYPEMGPCILILPGTHSKHVFIHTGEIVDFTTYMTGELFQLLFSFSILKNSLPVAIPSWEEMDTEYFSKGVVDAGSGNLLHLVFTLRAYHIQSQLSPIPAISYLSGLLIGSELQDLRKYRDWSIVLAADTRLFPLYACAIQTLGLQNPKHFLSPDEVKSYARIGQLRILLRQMSA